MNVLCWFLDQKGNLETRMVHSATHKTLEEDLKTHLRKENETRHRQIPAVEFEDTLRRIQIRKYLPQSNNQKY